MKRATTFYAMMLLGALALGPATAQAQYPRTVLIEEFTSVTCKPCTTATPILNSLIEQRGGRVVSIRYHLNFPSPGDPWYNANPAHNNGRRSYYGLTSLPYGRVDGSTTLAVTQQGDVYDKTDDRLMITSPVKLEVTQTLNGTRYDVAVKATTAENAVEGNYKLHIVALEAHIHDESFQNEPFNKEKDFEDVMRTMVPGPEGTDFSIGADETKTFNFSYDIGSGWQTDQMYTVAFVQDDITKEVVQAGYSTKPPKPSTSVEMFPEMSGYQLTLPMPNPVTDEAVIGYTLGARQQVTLELYDNAGVRVMTMNDGTREAGDHTIALDLRGLPSGVYTYVLHAGAYHASRRVTIVR